MRKREGRRKVSKERRESGEGGRKREGEGEKGRRERERSSQMSQMYFLVSFYSL